MKLRVSAIQRTRKEEQKGEKKKKKSPLRKLKTVYIHILVCVHIWLLGFFFLVSWYRYTFSCTHLGLCPTTRTTCLSPVPFSSFFFFSRFLRCSFLPSRPDWCCLSHSLACALNYLVDEYRSADTQSTSSRGALHNNANIFSPSSDQKENFCCCCCRVGPGNNKDLIASFFY